MRAHHRHYVAPEPLPLFEPPAQPVDTSLAAAAKITQHTARIREAIYLFIRASGGATEREIENGTGLSGNSVRPRLRELQGDAPWAKGKLPARIWMTREKRGKMHVYITINGGAHVR